MTLDSYMYGDPERIAIRHQEAELRRLRACGACIHRMGMEFKGALIHICDLSHRKFGSRCPDYRTTSLKGAGHGKKTQNP